MIDYLALAVPATVPFSAGFQTTYDCNYRSWFRQSRMKTPPYAFSPNLSSIGIPATLHFAPRENRHLDRKLELHGVSSMGKERITSIVRELFATDPLKLRIRRVDFAIDLLDVSVNTFFRTATVKYKRTDTLRLDDDEQCTVKNERDQRTIEYGKGRNHIRVYDKLSELQ